MSIIHKGLYRDACHRSGTRIIVLFLLLKKDIFRYLFFVLLFHFLLLAQKKVAKKTALRAEWFASLSCALKRAKEHRVS